jgi:hypothetical protein
MHCKKGKSSIGSGWKLNIIANILFYYLRDWMYIIHVILFCLAWEFDFTHVNDQHTKLNLWGLLAAFRALILV